MDSFFRNLDQSERAKQPQKGFVVRDAPWCQQQATPPQQQTFNDTIEEFPNLGPSGSAAGGPKPAFTSAWGPRSKRVWLVETCPTWLPCQPIVVLLVVSEEELRGFSAIACERSWNRMCFFFFCYISPILSTNCGHIFHFWIHPVNNNNSQWCQFDCGCVRTSCVVRNGVRSSTRASQKPRSLGRLLLRSNTISFSFDYRKHWDSTVPQPCDLK